MIDLFLNASAPLADFQHYILLVVRIMVAVVLIYYGWSKIKNLRRNAKDFVAMGFRPGWLWGTLIALLEFFGGIGILLGIYTGPVAFLLAVHMIVGIIWKIAKAGKPFSDWSYNLLLLSIMLLLLITGPGAFSF